MIQPAGHISAHSYEIRGYDARSLRTGTIDPEGGRFIDCYNPEVHLPR